MLLEKVNLFNTKRDFFLFIIACLFVLSYSVLIEYNNFKNLTHFDSAIVEATIIKQYTKTKLSKTNKIKSYQVLKVKADKGFSFYTTVKKNFPLSIGKKIQLEIFSGKVSFYEYLNSFYSYSKIIDVKKENTLKQNLNQQIDTSHEDKNIASIYKALYTASSMPKELQTIFSSLGISHLLAISGFHLGVLATVLFFIFKLPYKFLQNRYFPYRSYKIDSFIFIAIILLAYLLFLDSPPSLLRAYAMMIIGFFLYDRGYKLVSMQTLLLTIMILLSFFPRLFFALGFWLSVAGVFYIFLFLIYFKHLNKIWQFIIVPLWVYLMMLPYSLIIFSSFSLYHPLSIIWTSLFTLFYPLSIVLHLLGVGDIFDSILNTLILLADTKSVVYFENYWLGLFILLSLLSIIKGKLTFLLLLFSLLMAIDSIYQVTHIVLPQ
jgi:competence protein ComEC